MLALALPLSSACSRGGFDDGRLGVGDASTGAGDPDGTGGTGGNGDATPAGDADSPGVLLRLSSSATAVRTSDTWIPVTVTLEHVDGPPALSTGIELRFSLDGVDVTSSITQHGPLFELVAEPDLDDAGDAWVDLPRDLSPGQLVVDARATLQSGWGEPFETVELPSAAQTVTWDLTARSILTVSTANDEDDTGGVATVAAAGPELSLREALFIAETAGDGRRIEFAPAVFPADTAATILLDDALGAFPPLTAPGTTLDGRGVGVRIDGTAIDDGPGFDVRGGGIQILGLELARFQGGAVEAGCVHLDGAIGARVVGNLFEECDAAVTSGGQIRILDGADHVVAENTFRWGGADGIRTQGSPDGVLYIDNGFFENGDDGLAFGGSHNLVVGNLAQDNNDIGIAPDGVQDCGIFFNTLTGNTYGVEVWSGSTNAYVQLNTFDVNTAADVSLNDVASTAIRITLNHFSANSAPHIEVPAGGNGGVHAPTIDTFDGTHVTGTTDEAGLVEILGFDPDGAPVMDLAVEGGAWSVDLAEPMPAIRALFTNQNGCTSEMTGQVDAP